MAKIEKGRKSRVQAHKDREKSIASEADEKYAAAVGSTVDENNGNVKRATPTPTEPSVAATPAETGVSGAATSTESAPSTAESKKSTVIALSNHSVC